MMGTQRKRRCNLYLGAKSSIYMVSNLEHPIIIKLSHFSIFQGNSTCIPAKENGIRSRAPGEAVVYFWILVLTLGRSSGCYTICM